jgi:hypothetical protein
MTSQMQLLASTDFKTRILLVATGIGQVGSDGRNPETLGCSAARIDL